MLISSAFVSLFHTSLYLQQVLRRGIFKNDTPLEFENDWEQECYCEMNDVIITANKDTCRSFDVPFGSLLLHRRHRCLSGANLTLKQSISKLSC